MSLFAALRASLRRRPPTPIIWELSDGADEFHDDQEADLGYGWWISLGDDQPWMWELLDAWNHDEARVVAHGSRWNEVFAKDDAEAAARRLCPHLT